MILPVIGTIATRALVALTNLLIVVVSARYLGLEGVGTIALIVLAITFIQLINNIVGGSGLVYLAPRHGTAMLRWPAYAWAILVAVGAYLVLRSTALVPAGYELHAAAIALLRSLAAIHTNLLLGQERYGAHNSLVLAQGVLLFAALLVLVNHAWAEAMDYVHAAYIADGTVLVLSTLWLRDRSGSGSAVQAVVELFRQGFFSQLANGIQLLNYRLTYYLIDQMHGAPALGLWSITTQLAESAWLVPKSLGTVLYARVSNLDDVIRQRDLTLVVLKVAVAIGVLSLAVLLVLPDPVYAYIFGPQVHGMRPIFLALSAGLIAMCASQAVSHYLSGSGRVYHNTVGSAIGLVVTVTLGYQLIPSMDLRGAAITASAAYCAALIYQLIVFNALSKARLHDYLPGEQDIGRIAIIWRRFLGR